MNPVPWLQMTNMISYQVLVRTFLKYQELQEDDFFAAISINSEPVKLIDYEFSAEIKP